MGTDEYQSENNLCNVCGRLHDFSTPTKLLETLFHHYNSSKSNEPQGIIIVAFNMGMPPIGISAPSNLDFTSIVGALERIKTEWMVNEKFSRNISFAETEDDFGHGKPN